MASSVGRVCLVTGATSGLGKATARGLADRGATVLMVARDEARGLATRNEIRALSGNPDVEVLIADLACQASVRALAHQVLARDQPLHVLINNAGALFERWDYTPDGLERTFATNHMAAFQLTGLLLGRLRASAPARVITVSSDLYRYGRFDPADPSGERQKAILGAYSRSKLANVLFTRALALRLAGTGVTANCLHPGVVASNLSRDVSGLQGVLSRLLCRTPWSTTPEQAAATSLYLAMDPAPANLSGEYFVGGKPTRLTRRARDPKAAESLWAASLALLSPEDQETIARHGP